MKSCLIVIPTAGWIHHSVVDWIVSWVAGNEKPYLDYKIELQTFVNRPVENSRHLAIKYFLKQGYDYLLFCDSDNPPIKNPLELMKYDKDVIGLPTPINEKQVNVWEWSKKQKQYLAFPTNLTNNNLQRVSAVGTGCMLIHRRVLESPIMQSIGGMFLRGIDRDGITIRAGDINFCDWARAAGFKIWVHWNYRCNHYKEVKLEP